MTLWQDLRYALVTLRRSPAFAAAAIATLTIGIAAVCAVFTLVNAVLLQPLPYPNPQEIVFLRGELRRDTPREYPLSVLDLDDARRDLDIFTSLSPVTGVRPFNLAFGAEVEHVNGEMVSDDFFRVFSMPPVHGRTFSAAEVRAPNAAPVVILSHGFWSRRFGADPGAIGRTLSLNDRPFEIIGVAAPGFLGLTGTADLWLPIGISNPVYGPHYTDMRQFRWLSGVARLRPGVSLEQASEVLETWSANMAREHPQENTDLFLRATSLHEALFGGTRTPLLALLGAAAFVLLIGCVNVANLLLARGLAREREVAVRRALGASGIRVLRQFLTESIVLAVPACVAGLLLAEALTSWLAAIWAADLDSFVDIQLDARAAAVTVLVSVLASIAFGIVPALSASRVVPQRGLGDGSRGATDSRLRRRFQAGLVVAEVALALTLLAGAALMTKGFSHYLSSDLGFRADQLVTLRLDLTADRFKDADRYSSTIRTVLDAARSAPGVMNGALEGPGFPTGGYFAATFRRHGAPDVAPQVSTLRHHVSPGYFRTLGIPLLAGRDFDETDTATSPRSLIVSEALAQRTWPGENPLGQRLLSIGPDPVTWTVVGVVGNVRHEGRASVGVREPDVYISIFQSPARSPSLVTVLARTAGAPEGVMPGLVDAVKHAVPGLPPYDVLTMEGRLAEQTLRDRLAVRLMLGFAAVALGLAVVGVYSVIAYTVKTRTREIGIRAALGATRPEMVRLVLRQALWPILGGIAGGLVSVGILQRFVQSLFYGVSAADPLVLGGASLVLLLVGLLGVLLPALRAARIEPVTALKADT